MIGSFTSVFSDGAFVTTNIIRYDKESGFVAAEIADVDTDGECIREYITLPDGQEIDVCPLCHEYILKTVMVPDTAGKGLRESKCCMNPDCDYTEE